LRTDNLGKSALSTVIAISLLLSLFLVISGSHISVRAEVAAKVWTDKADYGPGETVLIFGENFASNDNITIRVIRPDSTDNTWIICDNSEGGFETSYQLDGIPGTYTVNAKDNHNNVAENTFTDTKPHFWISIDNINGIPGPTWENFSTATISLAGRVDVGPNFPGKLSDYQVQVDWGDNTVDNDSGINFVQSGTTFSGTWWSNPNHTYSASGTYTIIAKLYHGQPPGAESGDNYYQVTIVVILPPKGSISGSKWNDLSYNGVWDSGEPGLSGWTIQLYFFSTCDNKWINIDNENTGAGGSYKFSRLVAGNYRVNEVLKTGWIQTFPASPGIYNITLSEGENRNGINFGNVLAVRGVSVSISPSYENGLNGATLTYTVTVTNTGNASDTFLLTPTDNAGWSPSVSPNSLTLSPGTSDNATLSVTIPDNAIGGTKDNLKVTVTDNGVSGSGNCTAQVTTNMGTVQISFSPTYENGPNGAVLTYTVTVTNTGNVPNTYSLTATDNENWSPSVPTSVVVPAFSSENLTLSVKIPDNAIGGTIDNVTVTATGTGVSGSGNCTAQVTTNMGTVQISFSPTYENGPNGAVLTYTVTVTNTGNVPNTYSLTATNSAGWPENVSPTSITIPAFNSDNATLRVTIPDNAICDTIDNVTVTATGTGVSGSGNCTAQVTINRGVSVSISLHYQGGMNGAVITYTVTVVNLGNVTDTYDIKASDNLGWDNIWLDDNALQIGGFDNENTTTLHVRIPDNAVYCTRDNVTVTAISRTDSTVKDNDSCIAHAAAIIVVDVSISPLLDNGLHKDVTITNMGNVVDNYNLTVKDNFGWTLMLVENQFGNVIPGENRVTALNVDIPENAMSGTVDGITVVATSKANTGVSDNATANITSIRGVEVSISPTENGGLRGERLVYTVTIWNTGNVLDNYLITKTDVLGWTANENWAWLSIAPGHFDTVIFDVIIPENVKPSAEDVITVTATSMIDDTVSDNATSIAAAPNLFAGWNLLHFPLISENNTPLKMFGSHLKAMKYWIAPNGPYKEPNYNAPVELGVGYWVDVDTDMWIRPTGVRVENFTLELVAGWNLIGFPVLSENTTPFNMFGVHLKAMKGWTAPNGPYVEPNYKAPVVDNLGYWVDVDEDMTVTIPL
jgi:uncharacterized membrane protein